MISAVLAAIASMVGFTAIGVGEQELREYLGRKSRTQLNRLNARLQNIQNRASDRKQKIAEVKSLLISEGIGISNAAVASKVRSKRTSKLKDLKKEEAEINKIQQEASLEQALVDQRTADSYTYGGAISELVGKNKDKAPLENKINRWEDKL